MKMKAFPSLAFAATVLASCPILAAEQGTPAASMPTAGAPGLVRAVKVLPDKAPDCTSLQAIAASVTRGCRNNDEKAVAVYNFMNLTHYHRQYLVYPRMVFLRREGVAPDAAPSPLPEGAIDAKPAATDEVTELSSPFMMKFNR
jgi:hypothetical protein